MIVRRTWHGLVNDFSVNARTIAREGARNRSLLIDAASMRSIYEHPALEHFVCPAHDNGADSTPCATIEVV
jgi:hypothetical protein